MVITQKRKTAGIAAEEMADMKAMHIVRLNRLANVTQEADLKKLLDTQQGDVHKGCRDKEDA